jgi:hypothetical protein
MGRGGKWVFGWAFLILSHSALAMESTLAPSSARFAVIQSKVGAKYTFLLNTYSGSVFMLVKDNQNRFSWEPMLAMGLQKKTDADKPRYQIVCSDETPEQIYLVNFWTGKTWILEKSNLSGKQAAAMLPYQWTPFKSEEDTQYEIEVEVIEVEETPAATTKNSTPPKRKLKK